MDFCNMGSCHFFLFKGITYYYLVSGKITDRKTNLLHSFGTKFESLAGFKIQILFLWAADRARTRSTRKHAFNSPLSENKLPSSTPSPFQYNWFT